MLFERDKSGPRDDYFMALQNALHAAQITQPTLVLDKGRFDQNIKQLKQDLPQNIALRLVAKSLPCVPMLHAASTGMGTNRFMTFNAPMLDEMIQAFPGADQLLGKPFSVATAANFYSNSKNTDTSGRIAWLIDTPERLREYADLAQARCISLDISLELNVGLHRGGFSPDDDLHAALSLIYDAPHLNFYGFMGYEAHVAKAPIAFGLRDRALKKALGIYAAALTQARDVFGGQYVDKMVRNAAGSPTFKLYQDATVANDLSVGSALLQPTDFDTDLLSAYVPSLFIAAPALKVLGPMRTPVLEGMDKIKNVLNPNLSTRVFTHGGYWKACPVDPPGLRLNATYGRSSNQELLTGGKNIDLAVDDFVFLRPSQSEAILLHFGDIAVFEDGVIIDTWAPMAISA